MLQLSLDNSNCISNHYVSYISLMYKIKLYSRIMAECIKDASIILESYIRIAL